MKKILLSLGFAALMCLPLMAQNNENDKEFWGSADSYLLRQTARTLDLVDKALKEFPPTTGNGTARRLALYIA